MNGRVYDPLVGRMMSADPTIPDALNPQSWNRYSYVGNDPLTFTDPNGYSWLSSFFHAVARVFAQIPILRAIVQVALAAILGPVGGVLSMLGVAAAAVIPAAAAISAAVVTGLSGGNLGQILKAGAIAGATALAFNFAGDATAAINKTDPVGAYAFNVASHAGIGCVSAVASGGQCGPGALSGAAGAAATPLVSVATQSNPLAGTIVTAAVGGLASVAGGGKFENGAVTAAFGYLFNQALHDKRWSQIDILEEDARGGHTYGEHVGKSPEYLLARVRGERFFFGLFATLELRRAGSFPSLEAANKLVNSTLSQNAIFVNQVASGDLSGRFVTATFGSVTGYEAYKPSPNSSPYIRDTNGVGVYVIHDARAKNGFTVITAYPRND